MNLISPMLLERAQSPFDSPDYTFEFKFDGVRMLYDGREGVLYNRNLTVKNSVYPEILEELRGFPRSVVLDGEIIAVREGRQCFYRLLSRNNARSAVDIGADIYYIVFDVLAIEGQLTVSQPHSQRRRLLDGLIEDGGGERIKKTTSYSSGIKLFEVAKSEGMEGIVAKRKQGLYHPARRTADFLKIKVLRRINASVCGYMFKTRPVLFLGISEGGTMRYIGNAGSGLTEKEWLEVERRLRALPPSQPPRGVAADSRAVFVKPSLNVEVEFLEMDEHGKLRQPVIKRFF